MLGTSEQYFFILKATSDTIFSVLACAPKLLVYFVGFVGEEEREMGFFSLKFVKLVLKIVKVFFSVFLRLTPLFEKTLNDFPVETRASSSP